MTDETRTEVVLRTMRAVRSVRDLRPDPIPEDALDAIVEAARWTGSGMNRQPWTFVVVRDRTTLAAIATAATERGRTWRTPAAAIILVMDGGMPGITTFDEGRAAERSHRRHGARGSLGPRLDLAGGAAGHPGPCSKSRRASSADAVSLGRRQRRAPDRSGAGKARKPLDDVVR